MVVRICHMRAHLLRLTDLDGAHPHPPTIGTTTTTTLWKLDRGTNTTPTIGTTATMTMDGGTTTGTTKLDGGTTTGTTTTVWNMKMRAPGVHLHPLTDVDGAPPPPPGVHPHPTGA